MINYKSINELFENNRLIFLLGPLGAGKTTFVKNYINSLEMTNVTSPTFNIRNEYLVNNKLIVHYDLYRVKKLKEVNEMIMDDISNNNITFIEWANKFKKLNNFKHLSIEFKYTNNENERDILINGEKWN